MARRFLRRVKKRLRRLFRRKRSNFKRTFGMKKRKIPKVKPIYGRKKIKGIRKRVNNKPETKSNTYIGESSSIKNYIEFNTDLIAATTYPHVVRNTIFTLNGRDLNASPAPWYIQPGQGTGPNQIVGEKYNLRYAEVCFTLHPLYTLSPSFTSTDSLRIIIVKERLARTDLSGALGGLGIILQFMDFLAPVDTKRWDVQYDKVWTFQTGRTDKPGAGTYEWTSLVPKPKLFRFIIPLKETMEYQIVPNVNLFSNNLYIFAFTDRNSQYWGYRNLSATYYYRDP